MYPGTCWPLSHKTDFPLVFPSASTPDSSRKLLLAVVSSSSSLTKSCRGRRISYIVSGCSPCSSDCPVASASTLLVCLNHDHHVAIDSFVTSPLPYHDTLRSCIPHNMKHFSASAYSYKNVSRMKEKDAKKPKQLGGR
jgi:hypothetical protein